MTTPTLTDSFDAFTISSVVNSIRQSPPASVKRKTLYAKGDRASVTIENTVFSMIAVQAGKTADNNPFVSAPSASSNVIDGSVTWALYDSQDAEMLTNLYLGVGDGQGLSSPQPDYDYRQSLLSLAKISSADVRLGWKTKVWETDIEYNIGEFVLVDFVHLFRLVDRNAATTSVKPVSDNVNTLTVTADDHVWLYCGALEYDELQNFATASFVPINSIKNTRSEGYGVVGFELVSEAGTLIEADSGHHFFLNPFSVKSPTAYNAPTVEYIIDSGVVEWMYVTNTGRGIFNAAGGQWEGFVAVFNEDAGDVSLINTPLVIPAVIDENDGSISSFVVPAASEIQDRDYGGVFTYTIVGNDGASAATIDSITFNHTTGSITVVVDNPGSDYTWAQLVIVPRDALHIFSATKSPLGGLGSQTRAALESETNTLLISKTVGVQERLFENSPPIEVSQISLLSNPLSVNGNRNLATMIGPQHSNYLAVNEQSAFDDESGSVVYMNELDTPKQLVYGQKLTAKIAITFGADCVPSGGGEV